MKTNKKKIEKLVKNELKEETHFNDLYIEHSYIATVKVPLFISKIKYELDKEKIKENKLKCYETNKTELLGKNNVMFEHIGFETKANIPIPNKLKGKYAIQKLTDCIINILNKKEIISNIIGFNKKDEEIVCGRITKTVDDIYFGNIPNIDVLNVLKVKKKNIYSKKSISYPEPENSQLRPIGAQPINNTKQ